MLLLCVSRGMSSSRVHLAMLQPGNRCATNLRILLG